MKPRLTNAQHPLTFTVDALNERGEMLPTHIAGEYPLTIYIDKREIVTLMTLGQHPEALTVGYLRNQRIVQDVSQIAEVQVDWEANAAAVTTRNGLPDIAERMKTRTVTTGCGQGTVFGDLMEEIDSVRLDDDVRFTEEVLYDVLEAVRRHETIYKSAGAVHGCALADRHGILAFVEDVGRHNAVDTIAGMMWLQDIPGGDKIFYTTGRLTSEMVIKAVQMRIPLLVSRSGLTRMGYDIAQQTGITMIGRAVNRHYLLFTGRHRFVKTDTPTMVA